MSFTVSVDFDQQPEAVFDWLADLRHRPLWQASLRAVELAGAAPYDVGTRWVDVTRIGVRPLMEVTRYEPTQRWAERGHWHGIDLDLDLTFTPIQSGTTVRATATTTAHGWRLPIGWGLRVLGPMAARDDLRRAARLMSA